MLEWLLAPIDPSRGHLVSEAVAWHGRLMVLAWGFLLPLGVFIARFFKITPRQRWPEELDSKIWWRLHLVLQTVGAVSAVAALWLIVRAMRQGSTVHAILGWSVLVLLAVQVLGGWFRGTKGGPTAPKPDGTLDGDHFSMTPRRLLFERVHKSTGYLALLVACGALLTGLWLANGPRWMWLGIVGWWTVLIVAGVHLQRQGRAIDTYQAIWGPDPSLPGNQRDPIGWRVVRPKPRT
jgi:hypothetical protein